MGVQNKGSIARPSHYRALKVQSNRRIKYGQFFCVVTTFIVKSSVLAPRRKKSRDSFATLFAPLIKPAEVFAVPHHGVLRLEDPVVLVWEDQKSRRNSHHLCAVVCRHSLIHRHSIVHSTVDKHLAIPQM